MKKELTSKQEYLISIIEGLDLDDNRCDIGFGDLYYGFDGVFKYLISELDYSQEGLIDKVLDGTLDYIDCKEVYIEDIDIDDLRKFMGEDYEELDDEELICKAPITLWELDGELYRDMGDADGRPYFEVANITDNGWERENLLLIEY